MKAKFPILSLCFLLLFSCKKDNNVVEPDDENPVSNTLLTEENNRIKAVFPTSKTEFYLEGQVIDEDNLPLSNVEIKIGSSSTTTDTEGNFDIGLISDNQEIAVVKSSKPGYFVHTKTFTPTSGSINKIQVQLLKLGAPTTFDSETGGVVNTSDGIKIEFPAKSFINSSGNLYTGSVKIFMRYISNSDELYNASAPGSMLGIDKENKFLAKFSSGFIAVKLEDNTGKALQIAGDKKVIVEMPTDETLAENQKFWHFNEQYGIWSEGGTASVESGKARFEVPYFSYWDIGGEIRPIEYRFHTLRFTDSRNNPLSNVIVDIFSLDFRRKIERVWTNEEGEVVLNRAPNNLSFEIIRPCGIVRKSAAILGQETRIIIRGEDMNNEKIYQLSGIAKDCSNLIYANRFLKFRSLDVRNLRLSTKTDNQGAFSLATFLCNYNLGDKINMEVTVIVTENSIKKDTIELIFSGDELEKVIDFCDVKTDDRFTQFTDSRDGNVYNAIEIGNQTWMAENLKYLPQVSAPESQSRTAPYYYVYDYSGTDISAAKQNQNYGQYGVLYNWVASRTACPSGWHLPTLEEFQTLINFLGGQNSAGLKLKTTTGWTPPNSAGVNNESGFSALPAGYRYEDGYFFGTGTTTNFWANTENGDLSAQKMTLQNSDFRALVLPSLKVEGNPCRCVKDN